MEALKEFTIPFVGLKDGKHFFEFAIDNSFFEHFEYTDFEKAQLVGNLVLDKKPRFLELSFDVKGIVKLQCDVSMEEFDHPVNIQFELIVQFGSVSNTSDEILVLSEGSYQISVEQYFYEMIVLSIPQKRIHPGIKNGSLQNDIVKKLKELEPKENSLNGTNDPRWNKLKDLL
ncbi:MAG: DUF177 domain-containing protein [Flavobacteriaceae bacterium]